MRQWSLTGVVERVINVSRKWANRADVTATKFHGKHLAMTAHFPPLRQLPWPIQVLISQQVKQADDLEQWSISPTKFSPWVISFHVSVSFIGNIYCPASIYSGGRNIAEVLYCRTTGISGFSCSKTRFPASKSMRIDLRSSLRRISIRKSELLLGGNLR